MTCYRSTCNGNALECFGVVRYVDSQNYNFYFLYFLGFFQCQITSVSDVFAVFHARRRINGQKMGKWLYKYTKIVLWVSRIVLKTKFSLAWRWTLRRIFQFNWLFNEHCDSQHFNWLLLIVFGVLFIFWNHFLYHYKFHSKQLGLLGQYVFNWR